MKKTIIVATDFSPAAFNAANYAADMAAFIKADILLLHIYQAPAAFSEVPVLVTEEDTRLGAEKSINALKDEMVRRTGNEINVTAELRHGAFYGELEDACNHTHPYLVILGSQGTTAAERLLLGSHAVNAMKHLPWPLVTIPPKAKFSSIKKIGLACDFYNVADTIPAEEIKALVNEFNAQLHILNTAKTREFRPETIFESGILQELLGPLNPEYHFIASADTDEGIIEFAETNHIDLLVIIPRSHTLVDKLTHRSHTKHFVLHSPVPVMAIHA